MLRVRLNWGGAKILLIYGQEGIVHQQTFETEILHPDQDDEYTLNFRIEAVDLTGLTVLGKVIDKSSKVHSFSFYGKDFQEGQKYTLESKIDSVECIGLPVLSIVMPGFRCIEEKKEWIEDTSIVLLDNENADINATGKIRGRGNATWLYEKKPYALKFSEKQSPLGFPSNKSWVLLAEYLDKSFLRTAYMTEVSRAVNIDYTINYGHVNLFLNGHYEGVYVLTDKVEVKKNRVNVEKDGFLIEEDHWYEQEPLWFQTNVLNYKYTFKYPDADGDIVKNDSNYLFILDYMNKVESSLMKLQENSQDTEYTNYLDINSFAKYYVASEAISNADPNRFYVLPSKQSRLKMMPMWDAEWSFGFANRQKDPEFRAEELAHRYMWESNYFYKYLNKSALFWTSVSSELADFTQQVPIIESNIDSLKVKIQEALVYDKKRWPYSEWYMDHFTDGHYDWEEDVQFMKDFFRYRCDWMQSRVTYYRNKQE